ncbi:MAG: tRNA uridine-5-carboxymethylaminomethyl(34) synthesis GTPase MnmE [Prevotella sp.]
MMIDINNNDTICAIATATGGAIGIIRVSGPNAISITDSIFSRNLLEASANTIHYGNILDSENRVVDEVLVSIFRNPHSYTGEDSTEISCHGSRFILATVVRLLINAGCRQALPGEFTRRAFANGKLDLSQAEAVADLIASTNQATHRMAIGQLRGNISNSLSLLRDQLLQMTSLLELELDFSDHEELEFADRSQLRQLASDIDKHIVKMMNSFASGQAVKKGIPVAIVGKTNVGKSTLLNALLGEQRAIVSDVHGTTRDVIEDAININGVTFRFIDTAGLRDTTDEIERIGIGLTYQKLEEATIVLWVVDKLLSEQEVHDMEFRCGNRQLIVVNNKIDLSDITIQLSSQVPSAKVVGISARSGQNISSLRTVIYDAANISSIIDNDVVVTSSRHYEALLRAHESMARALDGMDLGLSGDLLSEELRVCLDAIAEITGRGIITSNEVLSNIFSHFCIGK